MSMTHGLRMLRRELKVSDQHVDWLTTRESARVIKDVALAERWNGDVREAGLKYTDLAGPFSRLSPFLA
jgi:hypothetical protein